MKCLEKDMVDFKSELRSEVAAIGQKVELLGVHFESGMREMVLNITSAKKDQFSQFYVRCLFAVSLTLYIIY